MLILENISGTLKKLLDKFQAPIRYAFAYGSGIFPQKGYDPKSKKMIDFIFGVRYPQHWHSLNLMQHRDHYSFMGSLGSGAISTLQENFGPGVYFNPYVNVDGMLIKYGVVSIDKLCKDLLDWETLYLAGRMHKPIKILRDDARVHLAQQVNLISALRTALLLLPKDFTEEQLYLTIASLSYKGDFRRYFGENPNKLKNIVLNQMHDFNLLYSGLINGLPNVEFITDGKLQQDDSPKAQIQLIKKLPRLLSHKIQEEHRMVLAKHGQQWPSDINDVYKSIINSGNYGEYIETSLKEIVFRSAITQSLKGILTAGLKKSVKYSLNKIEKWIKRSK
ncbi:4965_t:CDS:2 [Entrophospora sp. SA101]|nr:4965_t:CDS:2 [Entrophospora sp. SA101]